jgi:hypothetical protein
VDVSILWMQGLQQRSLEAKRPAIYLSSHGSDLGVRAINYSRTRGEFMVTSASLDLNINYSRYYRPLDPSGILCRPPLDPSAGVCFDKRKVESSIPLGSNFSHYLLDGACY